MLLARVVGLATMFISASGRVSQRSLKRVKEKEEIGAEDQSDNTESSNLLSETCFPAGYFFTAVVEETCGALPSSKYKGIFLDMI